MGTCRKKNSMLAKKEEVYIFLDSSYNLFRINPLDKISSEIAVARANVAINKILLKEEKCWNKTNFCNFIELANTALMTKIPPIAPVRIKS